MMKFFRQYTKQLLAVFMALLLIVWLAGDALTSLIRSQYDVGKQVRGTAYGETIRLHDMWPSFHQTETLDEIGMRVWQAPWYFVIRDLGMPNPQQFGGEVRQSPLSKEDWYMLTRAAEKARVHVPAAEVEEFKAKVGLTPDVLNQLRQRSRKSMEEIDNAIRSFIQVEEAALLAARAVKVSEADINDMVRLTGEKARVDAVIIDAKSFVDSNYQPTPQEIQAQFDKYKNIASQPGDVGYEQPQTAQVEYIQIKADVLAKNQKIDDEEAYNYWKANKNQFMKPTTRPATSSAPASQPAPYTSFSEAHAKVIEKLQKDRGQAEAQRLAREIIATLQTPWAKITTTRPGDAKTAPDSEKAADVYPKLVAELEKKHPGVLQYAKLEAMSQRQLSTQPAGSASALQNSESQTSLADAAMLVPGLEKAADQARSFRFYRGLYETAADPFTGADGNVYVLRTVAATAKHAPSAIDTVRTQIVQDLRNARAFEEAQKAAQKLTDLAVQKGLAAALDSDPALKQKLGPDPIKRPAPFAKRVMYAFFGAPQLYPPSVPELGISPFGRSTDLVDRIFALSSKATTQPVKVVMSEDKAQNRFVIAQLEEMLPVTRDEYNKQRTGILQTIEAQRRIEILQQWFDSDQIKARVNWVEAEKPKSEDKSDNS